MFTTKRNRIVYEMLLAKVIIPDTNLLEHIPKQMTHYLYKDCEASPQFQTKRRSRN